MLLYPPSLASLTPHRPPQESQHGPPQAPWGHLPPYGPELAYEWGWAPPPKVYVKRAYLGDDVWREIPFCRYRRRTGFKVRPIPSRPVPSCWLVGWLVGWLVARALLCVAFVRYCWWAVMIVVVGGVSSRVLPLLSPSLALPCLALPCLDLTSTPTPQSPNPNTTTPHPPLTNKQTNQPQRQRQQLLAYLSEMFRPPPNPFPDDTPAGPNKQGNTFLPRIADRAGKFASKDANYVGAFRCLFLPCLAVPCRLFLLLLLLLLLLMMLMTMLMGVYVCL
jgi:hypothetical protein